jgi:glycosyltransferase involved in cell wall biosynthesis
MDLGYCVDVISWANSDFIPTRKYSFFIDIRMNLERMAPLLNKDCIKIMHIDTAHWLFHMTAQQRRLLALQERRGVTLSLQKTVRPNQGIEHADCAVILGNEFTISTYKFANKPIFRVPISAPVLYSSPDGKDFDACRRNFLWFGSVGLVHKGLDLVLEAFAEMPDYHLTVCGPIDKETDFKRAYYKELYETPNIHTMGWVDISSRKFTEIANSCVGIIYPSCSEGGGGSVISCMHAGLIPVISYETSVDVKPDFGVILKDCSIQGIKKSIRGLSSLSNEELRRMARRAWEFARANHTRERFTEEYRKAILKIMATFGDKELSPEQIPGGHLNQDDRAQASAHMR